MSFFNFHEYLQYSLVFLNLVILIINVYCMIMGVVFETKKRYLTFNAVLTLLTSVVFSISAGANFEYRKISVKNEDFVKAFDKVTPVFLVLLLLLLTAAVLMLYFVLRWKRERITPASIKEAMDKLPAGLCYHNEKGKPVLINHRMAYLCRAITGEALFDGNEFWRRLIYGEVLPGNTVEKYGENPIITVMGDSTISFTRINCEIGGEKIHEIRATDITEQFALHLELKERNSEQRALNMRLQEYGETVWDITREREILAAKVKIHDMLGKAQLVTRRYIETGGADMTKKELTDIWNGTLYLFDGGFAEISADSNLDELYNAAKLMGITINVMGQIPKDNRLLRFIMSGARECLTNAVHHAKARELTVTLYGSGSYFIIEYTNDGKKPDRPISEGGGLSSLRQSVEKDGGTMETHISPQFILRLRIPVKEVY